MESPTPFRSARRAPASELVGLAPLLFFWLAGGALFGDYLAHGAHLAPARERPALVAVQRPELESKIRGVLVVVPGHPPAIARP
jgi:hypothetical protein